MASLAFSFKDSLYTAHYGMYVRPSEYLKKIHNIHGPIFRLDIENIDSDKDMFLSLEFLNTTDLKKVFIKERKLGSKYPIYKPIDSDFRELINCEFKRYIYGAGSIDEISYYDTEICYDNDGRVALVVSGKQESYFEYDSFDQLKSIKLFDSTYGKKELSQEELLEYDQYGNVSKYSFRSNLSGGWKHYCFKYIAFDYQNNWTHRLCLTENPNFRSETWRSIIYKDDFNRMDRVCADEKPPKQSMQDIPHDIETGLADLLF